MSNITLPTEGQIFGDEQLEVIKKRGTKAAMTDFAIVLGGSVSDENHVDNDDSLKGRTGYYWTKTGFDGNKNYIVRSDGTRYYNLNVRRQGGGRPVLSFTSIEEIPTNGEMPKRAEDGVLEVEYGYYPKSAPSRELQEKLEEELMIRRRNLIETENSFSTDSITYEANPTFERRVHRECEYNGKRYVRVKSTSYGTGSFILSNEEEYHDGDYVWLEVEPVKWLASENDKKMIPEDIIVSGIQGRTLEFFLETYLSKDFLSYQTIPTITLNEQGENGKENASLHTAEEAQGALEAGISAYGRINGSYENYLAREDNREDEVKGG